MNTEYGRWVEISFDCLPLRSIRSFDIPDDASPKLAEKMERLESAVAKHGVHNSYYLHNAACIFHLTNSAAEGMLHYTFDGVVLTDEKDLAPRRCDLNIELAKETCDWINQSVVEWMHEAVRQALLVEFQRYIAEGDLSKTIERIEAIEKESDESGGFVGMYL
ncbi:MAG: hypothetical protein AAF483_07160 [Planctomycetota bacterium]